MLKKTILTSTFVLTLFGLYAQQKVNSGIPLIGASAPKFTAESTKGTVTFPGESTATWKILFSHPKDFTPVCSSELLELAQKQEDFKKLGVEIYVLSTDALDQHKAWVSALNEVKYKDRAPVPINFPLIEDEKKTVSKLYGMLHEQVSSTRDVRGVFIVDPNDKIRYLSFYPMEIGRNIDEIERTVIALQTADKEKVLAPANWNPGEDVFLPYADESTKKDVNTYFITPFMLAKKMP
jgi:peroxiredoxin (alkyl hydroperoxide reductase subunit C)